MKNNKSKSRGILLLLLVFIVVQPTQAQFWKKLKKRVKDGVEEAVLKKAEEKATKKTENTIDSLFTIHKKIGNKKGEKDASEDAKLPATYHFEWKYALKIESEAVKKKKKDKGDMKFVYYLNSNTSSFATLFSMDNIGPKMGKTIMIMNPDTGTNLMLMDTNGEKFIQRMPSFSKDLEEHSEEEVENNYTIEKTDTKIILGYKCQGFRMVTEKGIMNTYIALNAPISFNNTLSDNSKFKPKGFDLKWMKEFENGLMMEMEFTSNEKKKHNMKMTCVELVEESMTINLNEYKSFMEMGKK
ncbi:MAG: DUF4412 domain-containing protein [Cellulophaga sp.]